MNYSIIRAIIGYVLYLMGIFLGLSSIVAACYHEKEGWAFLFCALLSVVLGFLIRQKRSQNTNFYAKEGFVTVSLCWITISLMGALPMYLCGDIPVYSDALFEIISGFTTTGSSIVHDVEALSHVVNFWRCFSVWIGGMGVLVFMLAVLPMAGGQTMHLMRAESPGPSVGKLVPRLQKTASLLYTIYFCMTVVTVILLLLGGMPLFDALCTSFATAGTGGFGIKADSIASYNIYCQIVITIFMFLFGVNFNFYYYILIRRAKDAFRMEEVRWYFIIFAVATILVTLNIVNSSSLSAWGIALKDAAFQCSTIMTTTGFATTDFNLWPTFSKGILVALMICGACAGSTGGGMKVSRLIIYVKTLGRELHNLIHPRSVRAVRLDDKAVDNETLRTALSYLVAYVLIFGASVLILCLDNLDLTTTFTAVATTFNNIGPGLGLVGPAGNFDCFSYLSKYVMMFDMLAGRLEIFPLLILFSRETWKK